jgi:hypothetical protein
MDLLLRGGRIVCILQKSFHDIPGFSQTKFEPLGVMEDKARFGGEGNFIPNIVEAPLRLTKIKGISGGEWGRCTNPPTIAVP